MKNINRIDFLRQPDGRLSVYVDGVALNNLRASLRLFNHSPSGFNIGFEGSGPAQLALAILMKFTDDQTAVALHQEFKRAYLNRRQYQEVAAGTIFVDIPGWIDLMKKEEG